MDIKRLITALEETIALLRKSRSSDRSHMTVEEIIQELESVIDSISNSQVVDKQRLGFLFAPTAAIQETAIDNGWGDAFLRISETVDEFTSGAD